MLRLFALLAATATAKLVSFLPQTSIVTIDGNETKGNQLDGKLGQCVTNAEEKVTEIKVCVSEAHNHFIFNSWIV